MKRIINKKGLTLVECVVAMAVLAIMSLLLTMLLSVTIQRRNANLRQESAMDEQIQNIIGETGDKDKTNINTDMKLYANGVEISDSIPGNKDGVVAQRVKHEGEDVIFDTAVYDFEEYQKFKDIANGKVDGGPATPSKGYTTEKCFGSLKIKDGKVHVKESITDPATKRKGVKADGTIEDAVAGVEYDYYIVTWEISLIAEEGTGEWDYSGLTDYKSVKMRIPPSASFKDLSVTSGSAKIISVATDVFRIESFAAGSMSFKVQFKVPAKQCNENYKSVVYYFNGIGDGNDIYITMKY